MPSYDPDRTVAEILKLKRSGIRSAPLPPGTPAWSELLKWTWAEIESAASRNDPGDAHGPQTTVRFEAQPVNTKTASSLSAVLGFLDRLEAAGWPYRLEHVRDSLMVSLATPGERIEIEFFEDGRVEVERFRSTGEIEGEDSLESLFDAGTSLA